MTKSVSSSKTQLTNIHQMLRNEYCKAQMMSLTLITIIQNGISILHETSKVKLSLSKVTVLHVVRNN